MRGACEGKEIGTWASKIFAKYWPRFCQGGSETNIDSAQVSQA